MKKGNKPCRNHRPDHIEVYNPTEATTLLPFLLQVLAPRSRTEVKSILAHSHVKVNGTATTQFDQPLAPGDEVLINFTHPFLTLNSRMVRRPRHRRHREAVGPAHRARRTDAREDGTEDCR